jgi:hypothetical protein
MAGTATISFSLSSTIYDSDVEAYMTATGITDANIKEYINTLVLSLKSSGLWGVGTLINPVAGGSAASHKINLRNPSDTDGAFRLLFSGGWTHGSTGMTPNGSTGYADTFWNPNTQNPNGMMSLGVYLRTNSASGTICDIGASNTAENQQCAIWARFLDTFYGLPAVTGVVTATANTDARGFFLASRTGSGTTFLQKNSTQNLFSEATGVPNFNIYVGARNRNNSAEFFSAKENAFVWIGGALTQAKALELYTIIQTFQTSMGRNV